MTKKIFTLLFILLLIGCTSNENSSNDKSSDTNTSNNTSLHIKSSDTNITQKEVTKQTNIQKPTEKKESLFALTTIDGKTIHIDELDGGLKIAEFKDKVVFLVLFGHQCPPCLAEIPALINLTKEGHQDVAILAIEVQGLNKDSLQKFAKNKGINYNLISGEKTQEFIGYIAQKSGWSGAIPFLLAMDKKGVVQVVHIGGLGKPQLDNIYKNLSNMK